MHLIATSGPWTRRRRVAYENPWIVVWHDDVTRRTAARASTGSSSETAAGVVVLDDSDQLLLVGQHRYTLDDYSWEIPEGGVAPTRTRWRIRQASRGDRASAREWRQIGSLRPVELHHRRTRPALARDGLSEGEAAPDPTEDLAVRWVPFDEALAMTVDGRITDAVSIMGIQRVALARLGGGQIPSVPVTMLHVLRVFIGPGGSGGNPLGVFVGGAGIARSGARRTPTT